MKSILKLVGWNWHFAKYPLALVCAVYGAQQVLLLSLAASRKEMVGLQMADLFMRCGQLPLFFIALYLVMLTAASASQNRGRSHTLYTMYTMPFSRMVLPAAQVLLCLAFLVIFTAWQIILYMAAYIPVSAISAGVTASIVSGRIPAGSFLDELNANPLFQLLLPVRFGSWLWLIGFWLLLSVQSACVAVCHGFRRMAAMVAAMIAAGVGAGTLYLRYLIETENMERPDVLLLLAFLLAATILPGALNMVNAAWALYRSETL